MHLLGSPAVTADPTITRLWAWTGLWSSVLLWAANTLLSLNLSYSDCIEQNHALAIVSLIMLVATGAGAFASWRSIRIDVTGFSSPRTFRFVGTLSALSSLVFAFALALQMVAAWVLTGCER
jgi:hypothetical protein